MNPMENPHFPYGFRTGFLRDLELGHHLPYHLEIAQADCYNPRMLHDGTLNRIKSSIYS